MKDDGICAYDWVQTYVRLYETLSVAHAASLSSQQHWHFGQEKDGGWFSFALRFLQELQFLHKQLLSENSWKFFFLKAHDLVFKAKVRSFFYWSLHSKITLLIHSLLVGHGPVFWVFFFFFTIYDLCWLVTNVVLLRVNL